jgi:recombinational DNA repair protein (RecF pathway)
MTTPWKKNDHVTFDKWVDCARCGMPWPEKEFRLQYGVKVCPECFDDPNAEDLRKEHTLPEMRNKVWEPD